MSNSGKTVVIGMSGGVDSSVAALLLKRKGFNVIAMFMKNWEETDENGNCMAATDFEDVKKVCDKIKIPYYSIEFVKEYRENVFSHFIDQYQQGFTPNPDVLCNREIKFKLFFERAMELGADFLATGHYCQNNIVDDEMRLLKGLDGSKDQSYFLYTIKKEILEKVMFPIGNMLKSDVRRIAHEYDLSTKDKKDSTGICFIGERNFREFLGKYINLKPGSFKTLNGEVVGRHTGSAYYTIGQRKGLGLGGPGEPWFVLGKDISKNIVFVERGNHPALFSSELTASQITWVGGKEPSNIPISLMSKIRYRQKDQECNITKIEDDIIHVSFPVPQRAVAPGQSIVFYDGDICLGGAVIRG